MAGFGVDKFRKDDVYFSFYNEQNRVFQFLISIDDSFAFLDIANSESVKKLALILLG